MKNEEIPSTPQKENIPPDPLEEELNELAHDLLDADFDDLSARKQKVIEYIAEDESIAENPNTVYSQTLTFGQILADHVARIGGSWYFVIVSIVLLAIWILLNTSLFTPTPMDPYPFILLNLALSMLTALQAPIIMMSQNRQAEKDRVDANANYEVCLKMELELTRIHQRFEELEEKLKSGGSSLNS